jgi:hypothetical protein
MPNKPAQLWSPDLGGRRGHLSDWVTQRWVQATGRKVVLSDQPWLDGPVGDTRTIGTDYFSRLAARQGLSLETERRPRGLLADLSGLDASGCRISELHPDVARFYEQTSEFDLDVWSNWCGAFRPFGHALALIFSRRLKQLNVPLSPLDASAGLRSQVVHVVDDRGAVKYTAWIRETVATGQTLYVGAYSVCRVPGHDAPCVKVVFPLPNGSAIVIMKASAEDGALVLRSEGRTFGDPGFYFYVESEPGHGWARHVRTMREKIRVFVDGRGELHAAHDLEIWRTTFLQLHYRMRQARN